MIIGKPWQHAGEDGRIHFSWQSPDGRRTRQYALPGSHLHRLLSEWV